MQRRRFKQSAPLNERLVDHARRLRQEARGISPGIEREQLIRKARQAETAAHIQEWLSSPGLQPPRWLSMQDMKASAEKLRAEGDNAEQIARSATDPQKRELYERLATHFRQLAGEIEKVIANRRQWERFKILYLAQTP
jgi:hypothetical protein